MRIISSCFLIICCVLALSVPVHAAGKPQPVYVPCTTKATDMDLLEVAKVKAVLKSNQIQMENGAVFILDNIRIPVPYERMARDFLEQLVKDKTVGLYANKTLPLAGQADDKGNEIVHAVLEDGTWVQEAMVGAGLAWVDSSPTNRDCVRTLYKAEIIARAKKKGFWEAPDFKIRDGSHMNNTIGTFIIFEGVPRIWRGNAGYDFFGFGPGPEVNRRTMTIALKHEDEYAFGILSSNPTLHPFTPAGLAHTRMRIRGWVEPMQGGIVANTPMMRLTHPEQLELPDGNPFN